MVISGISNKPNLRVPFCPQIFSHRLVHNPEMRERQVGERSPRAPPLLAVLTAIQLHSDIFHKNHGEIAEQNDLLGLGLPLVVLCPTWTRPWTNIKAGEASLAILSFLPNLNPRPLRKPSKCLTSMTLVFPFYGLHLFFSRTSVMMSISPSLVATGEPNIRVHPMMYLIKSSY